MGIYIYFQDENNRIRELKFAPEKGDWNEYSPTGIEHLKGLSGTSIACAADSGYGVKRWMYSQSTARKVQQCMHQANGDSWTCST